MLRAVASVRDEVLKRCAPTQIDLGTISKIFTSLTIVDYIVFVRYDTPTTNPIWGEFCRWSRQPSVYAAMETIVEIRYASHLTEDWRRLVVCKELCHSLDTSEGCHVASPTSVDSLVNAFSLKSHLQKPDTRFLPLQSEILAEAGAVELLCPLKIRKELLATATAPTAAQIAHDFNMPLEFAMQAVDPNYNEAVEWLLTNGN